MLNNPIINIKPLGFQWETEDPFLFCVHHEDFYPKGNDEMGPSASLAGRNIGQDFEIRDGWRMYHGSRVPGFPVHPHRGFETVTILLSGYIDHSDSAGATARFGPGDVQWLTAGKGIQHSEMFPLIDKTNENKLELFQIWLNLPKSKKFAEPYFTMFWKEEIPILALKDEAGKNIEIRLIAGNIGKSTAPEPPPESWAANHSNKVAIWSIKMDAGAKWDIPITEPDVNRTLFFFKGDKIQISGLDIENNNSISLNPNSGAVVENGNSEAHLLLLQGKPIGEPIAQYGPFVMNTREEIQQAYDDYRSTGFGGWKWENNEPVHPREAGRFAVHVDGKKEVPGN